MNLSQYAAAFITAGGFVDDPEITLGVVAWSVAENSTAAYNPLDTTQPGVPGATPYNTIPVGGGRVIHVWNYPSLSAGLTAVLATLHNGNYGTVLTALHDPAPNAAALARAVGQTPWGTGNFEALVTQVRADPAPYFGRHLAGSPLEPTPGADDVQIPTIQQGATGPTVRAAQALLNAAGAHLVLDGVFGPATANAARSFQGGRRLLVDGVIGPQTWAALLNG